MQIILHLLLQPGRRIFQCLRMMHQTGVKVVFYEKNFLGYIAVTNTTDPEMNITASHCYHIFDECIKNYHLHDYVDQPLLNPYQTGKINDLLYQKNWIDTVQWHLEDIIRDPQIKPDAAILIKRRIDTSNQERTDIVEQIDDYFLNLFKDAAKGDDARLNTETPAWVIDRLSILALKIYHMHEQTHRVDSSEEHRQKCQLKLNILLDQKHDLSTSFDELIEDIRSGRRYMKVYRQMKMYNDASLNPILYSQKNK